MLLTSDNGGVNWNSNAMRQVKSHKAVDEVENGCMDYGRFFVHLKQGYDWNMGYGENHRSKSFGGAVEALKALKNIVEI